MILKKAEEVLEEYALCDRCLGRLFGRLGKGENRKRGEAIRLVLNMEREAEGLPPFEEPEECVLCLNVFDRVDEIAGLIVRTAEKIEFESFLIGSRFPKEVLEREREIADKFGLEYMEPINREFNREAGKSVEGILGKPVDRKTPDVVFIVDPYAMRIELQIKPLLVYGRYRKLVRGIPQTPLRGYRESVASIICRPFSKASGGRCVFHGAGREDIDVRMLGNGRPFILEIKNPKRRRINLEEAAKEINRSGMVEVLDLRFSSREEMEKILAGSHRKMYEAVVRVDGGANIGDIRRVEEALSGALIRQKTPKRVLGRRADIIRERRVYRAEGELIDENHFRLRLLTDGGLYIKELISGDDGRTVPSVSSIIGKKAWCELLDVIGIFDVEELD
ncbi:tRNA pseudouridine(54/55) synthase Pus10 [Thermococcus atlanticus]